MNVSTEIARRVYNDDEGVFLEVGPGPDGFGVSVAATTEESKKWFGSIRIDYLSCAMASKLGEALIAASKECEG